MNDVTFQFLPANKYFEALKREIPQANKRIVIHAMTVAWDDMTGQLVPLLLEALARNTEVRIIGDVYTKLWTRQPKIARQKTPSWKHVQAVTKQLVDAGAICTYIGKFGLNPFKKRCHSKATIIDDLVYTFGGVNFTGDSFANYDYMLVAKNIAFADRIYNLIQEIEADKPTPLSDLTEQLSTTETMLFDGGTPGQSIIYKTTCDIVANAQKVYYVSQMCPSGVLAKRLKETEYYCYFVRPSQVEPPSNIALIVDKLRYGIRNRYAGKNYIHAKFILCEGKDGSKHVISGSNNFSWRGIAYGTKEIAVHSTDPRLWQVFYNFLQQTILGETK